MKPRTLASLILVSAIATAAHAGSFSAGIDISEDVDAEKTGLRVYPGAVPVRKKKGDVDSANVQFSFGEYGLSVVVAKMQSTDLPEKVAEFYRGDLARFGNVLDCTLAGASDAPRAEDKKSKALTCDGDRPRKSGMVYKAGRKEDQHVVEIKPTSEGSEFSLVYLKVRRPD